MEVVVWWQDDLAARLDQLPGVWPSFPELFAGGIVPFLGRLPKSEDAIPKAFRIALSTQYDRDTYLRFRQIELRNTLSSLFVDVPSYPAQAGIHMGDLWTMVREEAFAKRTVLHVLMGDESSTKRVLLEGGPGQGKSTVTQMAAQILRAAVLGLTHLDPEGRWRPPSKLRVPFRVELRALADWLSKENEGEVDEYLALTVSREAGGRTVTVEDLHSVIETTPTLFIFDGLDEVGSNELRDLVLEKIADFQSRAEGALKADIKTVVTTRPPAIAGRLDKLPNFTRWSIWPLSDAKISEYLTRWLQAQCEDIGERSAVRVSFESRRGESHVAALSRNPMQLSVLLHFIRLKGQAFPDRRAELYREYFKVVIDRDVEKSVTFRQHRDVIEVLHQLIGFGLHMLSEAGRSDGTLSRASLLSTVKDWLKEQGTEKLNAEDLFALGEERLGLIAAVRGEGEATQ